MFEGFKIYQNMKVIYINVYYYECSYSQNQPIIIFKFFNNQKCHGGFTAIFLFNAFILSHHHRSHMPNDTDQ